MSPPSPCPLWCPHPGQGSAQAPSSSSSSSSASSCVRLRHRVVFAINERGLLWDVCFCWRSKAVPCLRVLLASFPAPGVSPRGPAWGDAPPVPVSPGRGQVQPQPRGAGGLPRALYGRCPPAPCPPALRRGRRRRQGWPSASPALWHSTQHPAGSEPPQSTKSPHPCPFLMQTGTEGPQVTSPGPAGHPWVPPPACPLLPCALRAPHVPQQRQASTQSGQGHPQGAPPSAVLGTRGSEGTKKGLGGPVSAPRGGCTCPTCHRPRSVPAPCHPGWEGRTQPGRGSAPPLHTAGAPWGVPILLSTPGQEAGCEMWGRPTATAAQVPRGSWWGPRVAKRSPMQSPSTLGTKAAEHPAPIRAPWPPATVTPLLPRHCGSRGPFDVPSVLCPSRAPPGARGGEGSRALGQVSLWQPPSPDSRPWRAA